MITVHYDDGGVRRSLDLAVNSLQELGPILRRFGSWMRKEEIAKTFDQEGPGWAPLAASTIGHLRETRTAKLTAHGKVRAGYLRNLSSIIAQKHAPDLAAPAGAAPGRQDAYKRATVAGRIRDYVESGRGNDHFLRMRAVQRLRAAAEKHEGQSDFERTAGKRADESHKLLGRIRGSITAKVEKSSLEIYSKIAWAGVHNEGGSAGRGSQIPARTFLEWTPARVAKLAEFAEAHMLESLKGAR